MAVLTATAQFNPSGSFTPAFPTSRYRASTSFNLSGGLKAAVYKNVGLPAFQITAFQTNAFQTGYIFVAPPYSIGSLSFATPVLNKVLTANTYSLGSPAFATPAVHEANALTVNAYSIGPLSVATPGLSQKQNLTSAAYAIGSPDTATTTAILTQTHNFTSPNTMALGALGFATPSVGQLHPLTVANYTIGILDFHNSAVRIIGHSLSAVPFSLDRLRFGFPRLIYTKVVSPFPALYLHRVNEADVIINGMLDLLLSSIPATAGTTAFKVRRLVSKLRAEAIESMQDGTFGTRLQDTFEAAEEASATFEGVDRLRAYLVGLEPEGDFALAVMNYGLIMAMGLESKIITNMTFINREEVRAAIVRVRNMFQEVKDLGLDELDVATFQAVNALGGAVINHLAKTELKLPRIVRFTSSSIQPALTLAQRIYQDGGRWEEIADQNDIIHPAFCPLEISVLSN